MTSDASVDQYLAELPDDRRDAITRVRNAVNASLPTGYEEVVAGGAIRWVVPLGRYPDTVDGEPLVLASLASRKHHMTFDLGGRSTRFKRLHDLDLHAAGREVAGTTVEDLIERYETSNP
jgi:hypothetical protein